MSLVDEPHPAGAEQVLHDVLPDAASFPSGACARNHVVADAIVSVNRSNHTRAVVRGEQRFDFSSQLSASPLHRSSSS